MSYYIHDLSPFIFQIGSWGPRWYGVSYVLSFYLGYKLYCWLARHGYTDMPEEKVADFITLTAVFGVMLGGRLGWALFYWLPKDGWRAVLSEPLTFFKVWEGGMASHGGILGIVFFTLWFSRRHKLSWTGIGDSMCVVAPIGLFLVRCANFINGELFGKPAGLPGGIASVPWAMIFPGEMGSDAPPLDLIRHDEATRHELRSILAPRHPSQIYEALLEGVVLFAALWILRTKLRVPRGVITGVFFILYAVLRIVGEMFREPDTAWHAGPLSAGQTLSLFMIVIGAVFVVWGFRTGEYERALTRASGDGKPSA